MKNIRFCLPLFIALICSSVATAQKDQTTNVRIATQSENIEILRQTISRPITRLQVKGTSSVVLIYDSTNYIDVVYNPEMSEPVEDGSVTIKGTTLTIDDKTGEAVYKVHLKEADLQLINQDRKANIIYSDFENPGDSTYSDYSAYDQISTANLATQQALESARQALKESREQLKQAREQLKTVNAGEIVTDTFFVGVEDSDFFDNDIIEVVVDEEGADATDFHTSRRGSRTIHANYYDWDERLSAALLGGFVNWGDQWYNGLSKLDGDYNLKTSFSSWQIDVQYAVVMTRHFNLSLGVGYESDVFRFTTPFVECSPAGIFYDAVKQDYAGYDNFILQNTAFDGTREDDWSSKLVTRYISIPAGIGFRSNDFHIEFTALPALAINTRHTGLKQVLDSRNVDARKVEDISKHLSPYKLDLRAEVRYQWFGIYAQVATMSLFDGTSVPDIYPFKLGFLLKFNID